MTHLSALSFYTGSISSLPLLLALGFGVISVISFVKTLEENAKNATSKNSRLFRQRLSGIWESRHVLISSGSAIGMVAALILGLLMGIGVGWSARGLRIEKATIKAQAELLRLKQVELDRLANIPAPLTNVTILRRHNACEYRMQTENGQAFETKFCADSCTDLEKGERLQTFTYEQRPGCKSINGPRLGWVAYNDQYGNRIKYPVVEEIADVR